MHSEYQLMSESNSTINRNKKWWGEFDLQPGKWAHWKIGPMDFMARTSADEWRFAWKSTNEMLNEEVRFEPETTLVPCEPEYSLRRYALENSGNRLKLIPRLADRPVVVRPETPLFLPPGQRTKLYVSTGVWLSVSQADDASIELFETPVYRASDTWFGLNTLSGELCYTAVTSARTDASFLAQVPHRAFTPVDISNNGSDALEIEYLRVPVMLLGLYAGASGRLWTDQITFEREHGESVASLRISSHDAFESATEERLSGPRRIESTGIAHSFSKIFSKVT